MKLSEEDFDMMLNAAWSAFENTLFLWGMSKDTTERFCDELVSLDAYDAVEIALRRVVKVEA